MPLLAAELGAAEPFVLLGEPFGAGIPSQTAMAMEYGSSPVPQPALQMRSVE